MQHFHLGSGTGCIQAADEPGNAAQWLQKYKTMIKQ
jgi:hypothetical protein